MAERADARRNRERLLRVATEAFATGGLGVPLDEIARRAGVGPGTLYRHFPTKEALFQAVVHERLQGLIDAARELGVAEDPGQALIGFLGRLVAEAAPKKDLIDALVGSGVDVQAQLTATATELRDEIERLLRRAQRALAVRADITVADLMALTSGLLLGLQTRHGQAADAQRTLAVIQAGLRPGP
jgi:AcrR family transcriptional regulator